MSHASREGGGGGAPLASPEILHALRIPASYAYSYLAT